MLRDASLGLRHATMYFYEGHGFIVRANAGVTQAREMRGATICLLRARRTNR